MPLKKFVRTYLTVMGVIIIAGAIYTTSWPVAGSAKEISSAQPYCIQVADNSSDYRPAQSWLDLSFLTMWAKRSGSIRLQHHAILVVGDVARPQLFHWSYRLGAFESGVLNEHLVDRGPAVTCVPEHGFLNELPTFLPRAIDKDYVRYSAQEVYLIPRAWKARWSGGISRTLLLLMTSPDIRPSGKHWNDLSPEQLDANWLSIEWNPNWVEKLMKSRSLRDFAEQTMEFGLLKNKIIIKGTAGKIYESYDYLKYLDNSAPHHLNNITIIGCGIPSKSYPKSCQHRFVNRGRSFYFTHRPDDVANWRNMQQRIVELIGSFEVDGDAIFEGHRDR